jgi:ABC-type transport system substrate-binding protein
VSVALLAAVLAGCTPASATSPKAGPRIPNGGVLRVVMPPWNGSDLTNIPPKVDALDPQLNTGSTFFDSAELFRCCLLRTLYSNIGRPASEGGAELHPDLAVALPYVSADGLTWTFRIRQGVKYAPPIHREIVAADFVRALQRQARLSNGQTRIYSVIAGFDQYRAGTTSTILGLETPDRYTLRVHLDQVAGDLPYRFTLSNSAPIPPDPTGVTPFGVATGHDAGYGRFLVASGPYMIKGSPQLDFRAAPEKQRPLSGFVPGSSLTFVRNPSWSAASDPLRPAFLDEIRITFGISRDDAARQLEAHQTDLVWLPSPPQQVPAWLLEKVRAHPDIGRVVANSRDVFRFISMNLAVPPFDDIHVRKAVNYIIDKEALAGAYGGNMAASIATHIAPDGLESNALAAFDPFATPDHKGSLDLAVQEMRQSRYDVDHSGTCSSPLCKNILALTISPGNDNTGMQFRQMGALIASTLRPIGITLDVQSPRGALALASDPGRRIPLMLTLGGGKWYMNASSIFAADFAGPATNTEQACDPWCRDTMLGASPEQLRRWGYQVTSVPSVDSRIRECSLGGDRQSQCWADLDIYLMEKVVPIAPYALENIVQVIPPRLVNYAFDQFANSPAFDQIAVKN